MSNEHVLDGSEDLLLTVAWQGAHALENGFGFTNRAGAALLLFAAEKEIRRDTERFGELGELIGAKTRCFAFPVSDDALTDAELICELLLSQSGFEARDGDALA
jgi:hypothetical protein